MDQQQQLDDWQFPLWSEQEIDASYFEEFLATDVTQDETLATSMPPDTFGINTRTSNTNYQDLYAGSKPGSSSNTCSVSYLMDATPNQAVEGYRQIPVLRQHTLPRRRSKYMIRTSIGTSSPIAIPISSQYENEQEQSLTMQRWRNSPPEDEAASFTAICDALDGRPVGIAPRISCSSNQSAFRKYRGPSSTTSLDSAASESSLRSANSSHSATSQTRRRSQASRTRKKGKAKIKNADDSNRIFKCTFCCDTFKTKYDWTRHEKSLHLNMEEWVCTPHGASVVLPLTGRVHCAYCSALDPTPTHLQQHNHEVCGDGQSTPRIFRRKDHLVQHLRLVHGLDTLPLIDDWKLESGPITSRCGICDAVLRSWDERADHLTAHFREGKTMDDWTGEHGFEPAVSARVLNAFPPYLIADQAKTVVPFSATNPGSIDHTKQFFSHLQLEEAASALTTEDAPFQDQQDLSDSLAALRTTPSLHNNYDFATVLTRHLSRFARQQMLLGIIPTDEMFQRESRRLFYQDGDDGWNQTLADHPSWLQDFRQQGGFM
ncbi:hypothetical protein COCSADRAFT_36034 [Bipolaris sorokiniana ND90Pr]|uniref:C2H2-type domain-containing protein n=1 Tax=Cochliobolus sativus (strain ND90Pr / ATCC 201652) TaxID=665912 RepID=M2SBJ3_COCSN|nr:uncharacterized protein COCSADRAFT_36034 [Bipolaris sorokiniana ND90Pr]EMD64658.1 hypothetical protein COCSADRAFT_36034 [Bipolaris sorokiniana ND90Pr]